jgi:OmpA-OmpF porin, OOP family
VHFDIDSSDLSAEETAALQQSFAPADASIKKVAVFGYCDNIGEERWNFILSRRRAEAVAKLAAAAYPDTPLETEGLGSEHPVASNKKGNGRALNRRAVVMVCGK